MVLRTSDKQNGHLFRCGYEDKLIEKFPKPPKDNNKQRKQVRLKEKGNRAWKNSENNSDQKIYASMSRISGLANVLVEILMTVHN